PIMVPTQQRSSERSTGVARGRLNPDLLEWSLAQNPPVPNAIEGNATGETEIPLAREGVGVASQAQHHLLRYGLERACDIHVPLGQFCFRFSGRAAQEAIEHSVRHPE